MVQQFGGAQKAGNQYLVIVDPTVALKVLLQDSGHRLAETIEITKVNDSYVEGALRDVRLRRYERSSAARQACLSCFGYDCFVCGENLRSRYGNLPMELIHVHHEEPLAANPGPHKIDPIAEMKPVCPNCHAVIHSKEPPYTITEMKEMLK